MQEQLNKICMDIGKLLAQHESVLGSLGDLKVAAKENALSIEAITITQATQVESLRGLTSCFSSLGDDFDKLSKEVNDIKTDRAKKSEKLDKVFNAVFDPQDGIKVFVNSIQKDVKELKETKTKAFTFGAAVATVTSIVYTAWGWITAHVKF